jgi:hypothetical protein
VGPEMELALEPSRHACPPHGFLSAVACSPGASRRGESNLPMSRSAASPGAVASRFVSHHTAVVSSSDGAGVLTVVEQHIKDPATGGLPVVVRKNKLYVSGGTTKSKPSVIIR